ncbi:MAG TPA: thiamine ABC transporter substrate-binding protein [Thermoplasmata archaeon]|nr:thiamine ABC transporter substrate-binding protein [Thermoplasmata archaeon]
MSSTDAPVVPRGRLRRPGRAGQALVAVALSAGLVLAGLGTYDYVQGEFGGTTLVVLTYPSLFGGNCGGTPAFASVFGSFASAHDVRVEVECPPGTLYSSLVNQTGAPVADVVVGLDELTAPEAEAAGLLVPYAPPGLADVPGSLVAELSPDDAVVPYEYGYLAIDVNSTFYGAHPTLGRLSFPGLVANASWARNLLVEDPEEDITGEEFLAWQIAYYTYVLHENWTSFWTGMPRGAPPLSDSWGDAFDEFEAGVAQMVVSYSTDPAYAAAYGEGGSLNSTVSWWNGTAYGWRTIYGIGIVRGSHHLALDEQLENWFLSSTVQSEIPTNEWEYPANDTVALPPVYAYAIDPASVTALNEETTPAAVGAALPGWLHTWATIAAGHG